jgi:hypothetical protein
MATFIDSRQLSMQCMRNYKGATYIFWGYGRRDILRSCSIGVVYLTTEILQCALLWTFADLITSRQPRYTTHTQNIAFMYRLSFRTVPQTAQPFDRSVVHPPSELRLSSSPIPAV